MTGDEGVPPIDDWNRLLDGRVAVFTGGGDGIGAGIARLFARHGALVEVAEIDRERADRVRAEISGTGGRIRSHVVDVTVDDGVTRLAEIVLAEHGRVDVLVNNVGDSRPLVPFAESPPDSWQRMYEINLRHVFAVTRAFVPSMIAAHRGSIVTGHSVDGMRGYPKDPVSGAMKAAAAHFTTCLAVELIVDDGRVVGAVAETDGARRAIRARRGVLLAAGGSEQNDPMRAEYRVPGTAFDTMGAPRNLGLAHRAAIAVGASTNLMDQAWWSPGLVRPDGRAAFALCFTGGIFVDRRGRRFVNESTAYDRASREIIRAMNEGTVGPRYWMIYDSRAGEQPPVMATNVSFSPTNEYVSDGLWRQADSLAELAAQIDVPADDLVATVRRFNEFARRDDDKDFGRGREAFDRAFTGGASPLVPIDTPPYRAAAFGDLRPRHQGRAAHRCRRAGAGHRRSADPRPVCGQHHGRRVG